MARPGESAWSWFEAMRFNFLGVHVENVRIRPLLQLFLWSVGDRRKCLRGIEEESRIAAGDSFLQNLAANNGESLPQSQSCEVRPRGLTPWP